MSSPDTMGGGLGQVAGEMLKEMQKAQTEMQQLEQKQKLGGPNEAFQQAMQAQQGGHTGNNPQPGLSVHGTVAGGDANVTDVLRAAKAQQALPSTKVGATEKAEQSKLAGMLDNLINGQDKMTKIMHMALSGRQFSPTELLAMQAGVYRFSQELDLTSKVVEKATGGIKQTLNTQV
jgi:hypothetical protein